MLSRYFNVGLPNRVQTASRPSGKVDAIEAKPSADV
jgi:hypothetical protein